MKLSCSAFTFVVDREGDLCNCCLTNCADYRTYWCETVVMASQANWFAFFDVPSRIVIDLAALLSACVLMLVRTPNASLMKLLL